MHGRTDTAEIYSRHLLTHITTKPIQMELKEQFEKAIADSKNLPVKPSNDTLLQLYSLYKQASEGDINIDPPSNPFDFVAKAKFEAWAALKGKTTEEAMHSYIDLVSKLKN